MPSRVGLGGRLRHNPGMTQDVWNPAQYDRFRGERSQPFFDVLSFVRLRPGMRVVDLGCGTGELTGSQACAGEGLRSEQRDIILFCDKR